MANLTTPPLRSAMKHSSRPTTPTSSSALTSPDIPPLPSVQIPTVTTARPTLGRTQSASSILEPHAHKLQHPPLPHHAATSPSYTHKVSFDTFENPAASMFSFTLQVKSEGYRRTRNTRVFLCASSPDESGSEALEWCLESLVQDGDELIIFRGADEDVLGSPFHHTSKISHLIHSSPQKKIITSSATKPANSCRQSNNEVSSTIPTVNYRSSSSTSQGKSQTQLTV